MNLRWQDCVAAAVDGPRASEAECLPEVKASLVPQDLPTSLLEALYRPFLQDQALSYTDPEQLSFSIFPNMRVIFRINYHSTDKIK
jgi:hypothetical protein